MKLNNLSRLTALLLALTMFLSSVAWADPVAEGDYTADNYAEMLAAQTGTCAICVIELFPTTDHNGNTISITCAYEYLAALGTVDRYNFMSHVYNNYDYEVYASLYSAHTQHVDAGAESLLCTCPDRGNTDLRVPGAENHEDPCPWTEATETSTVIKPNIPQPPVYGGDPQGKQYTETLEYTLPMEEDRAVILQTGARAILTSESTTPGVWQVYTGEEWVDIQGDNTNVIEVTEAKLNTIFELTGVAQLRYFDKANSVVLDEVAATTKEIANGEYVDLPEQLSLISRAEGSDIQETDGKYYVYVYYVYGDDSKHAGKTVADPMIAEVNNEQAYQKTVESPVIPGYAPDQTKVEINVTKDSETKEFYVYYSPTTVEFKVKHYQQNLLNDDYTLEATDEKTGKTEDSVGQNLEKDTANTEGWKGFYALLYDGTTEIAADGSTVIEIYYDRNYYLMKFDANGGYGAESIFARVGAGIGTPKQPTRAGYTFAGWLDEDDENGTVYTTANFPYTTMPAKNTSFVAQWTSIQTSYDVVFWYENADDDGYSQAGVLNDVAANSGDIVNGADYANTNFTGKDAEHFTYSHADQNVVVKGDGSTVVNVYFSRNVYTMTFEIDSTANCTLAQHKHSESCYNMNCTREPHNHVTAGCTLGTGCTHTAHGTACYRVGNNGNGSLTTTSKPTQTLTDAGNGIYTYTTGSWMNRTTHYYVQIGEQWYRASNGDTTSITFSCSHTHSDACYSCGKTTHAHSGSCYGTLKCTLQEHYHEDGKCYYVVRAKYDSNIASIWKNSPVFEVIDAGDSFTSSATGAQTSFLEKMPGEDLVMEEYDYNGTTEFYWTYYIEVLPGQNDADTVEYDGKYYRELTHQSISSSYGLSLSYDEDYYPVTGFTQLHAKGEGGWTYNSNYGVYVLSFGDSEWNDATSRYERSLYYTRNSYDLTFSNNGDVVEGKGGSFLYEADISGQYFVPAYPADLEAGAYTFDGWYTSPFFGDTKFEFTTTDEDGNTVNTTMPAKDITLYARWVPITHEVNIYVTEGGQQIGSTETVDHNDQATEIADPKNGRYTFVGWFYKDGETEKAFDFSMPITKDMEIYAKWISNTLMPYTIKYAVQKGTDENGKPIYEYIAKDTTGSALAGTTKTFQAKYGDELDAGYQTGYFPHTNSHSLVIDIDDETKNVFTFVYTPATKAPYTVYYLAEKLKDGGTSLGTHPVNGKTYYIIAETKTVAENTMVAVSEKYKYVQGYMPDAIQKQLILSADPADNVLYFFYTVDDKHAPVQIVHYVQNATGEEYSIYQNYSATTHTIGEVIRESTLDITGFEFVRAEENWEAATVKDGVVTATLTAEGLLLELYYDRILYDYEFKFLDQDTKVPVADSETGEARYGASVSQNAKVVTGYTLVSDEKQSMVIDDEPTNNVRIFYYTENEATINYIAVTKNTSGEWVEEDATGGTVQVGTVAAGATATDTVAMVTGVAKTAEADPNDLTFKFVGWYTKDANGDYKEVLDANGKHITTPEFTPTKANEEPWIDGTTYYALFEYNLTSMTIWKAAAEGTTISSDETFILTVTGYGLPQEGMKVIVQGTGSVVIGGLTVGQEYTVTEDTAWSWRYDAVDPKKITLAPSDNKVVITNSKTEHQWLSDESSIVNFDGTNQ